MFSVLKFVPIDKSGEIDLFTDNSVFRLSRSFLESDSYIQKVTINQPKSGIIYFQDPIDHTVYYDFITPFSPFYLYINTESAEKLSETCPYSQFINDTNFDREISGFSEISKYFKSYDFLEESESNYIDNGITPGLYKLKASKEVADAPLKMITQFDDEFWSKAKQNVKGISFKFKDHTSYPDFFQKIVDLNLDRMHQILNHPLTVGSEQQALNQKIQDIKSELNSFYDQIKEVVQPVNGDEDELEDPKLGLQMAYSEQAKKIFTDELNAFEENLKFEVSLPATLFYFAKSKANFEYITKTPDQLIDSANNALGKSSFSRMEFLNIVSKLNLDLLKIIFAKTNELWLKNDFMEILLDTQEALVTMVVTQLESFVQSNPTLNEAFGGSVDQLNFENFVSEFITKSHPFFVYFVTIFKGAIDPLIGEFFDKNTQLIKSFKQKVASKFDGSGPSGFTSKFYRLSFENNDPEYSFETEELVEPSEMFDIVSRLLI